MSENSVKQVKRILVARDKSIEHHLMGRQILGMEALLEGHDIRAYSQIFQERVVRLDADISGFASNSTFVSNFENHLLQHHIE